MQVEDEDEISPSREKINNLSSHIFSSLDQGWVAATLTSGSYQHLLKEGCGGAEQNPVSEVMQKIIHVTTPLLHLNHTHMQTLMSSACSGTHHLSSSASLDFPSSQFEQEVHSSPTTHLLRLGYQLIDKPLTVRFSCPCDGHVTLVFELTDLNSQKRGDGTFLKVRYIL
jgi:hypothetical protein